MYDRYSEEAALITRITLLRAKIKHSTEQIRRELEEKYPYGRGRCATKVREAVESGLGRKIPAQDMPPLRKGPKPPLDQMAN